MSKITWSKAEKAFAARFKEIEQTHKSSQLRENALNTLERLNHLSNDMRSHEQVFGNSRLINTLEIVSCSLRAKIYDELGELEKTLFYFKKITAQLIIPNTLSPENIMRLLKENADFLAFSGMYDEALQVLDFAWKSHFLIEEKVTQHWKLYLLQADLYMKNKKYSKAEYAYQKAKKQIERIMRVYPELISDDLESRELALGLFSKMADLYMTQEKFFESVCLFEQRTHFENRLSNPSQSSFIHCASWVNHFSPHESSWRSLVENNITPPRIEMRR